jgi:L-asparaginase
VVASGGTGVVVTHGTDAMEETAFWLDLTYGGSAPVVFTGATKGADHPDADGPQNLENAVTVAASADARRIGVVICLDRQVFSPRGTRKVGGISATGFEAGPRVGVIDHGYRALAPKRRPFLGAASAATAPRVDVVTCYVGADAVALDACVAAGARGVVLEALGSGNAGFAIREAVRRHCAAGVKFAVSTRVPFGGTHAGYGPGRELVDAGAIVVPRLGPPQARVLLMAALATGSSVEDVVARWG